MTVADALTDWTVMAGTSQVAAPGQKNSTVLFWASARPAQAARARIDLRMMLRDCESRRCREIGFKKNAMIDVGGDC